MAANIKISTQHDIKDLFTDLGEKIRIQWSKYHFTEDALVESAIEILSESNLHTLLHPNDLIHYALNPPSGNAAHQIDSPFGDLQQIMYSHSKFYIETLYWCDGTTAIHDHGFSGAFYVMSGSSINVEYDFDIEARVNHHFTFGKLSNPQVSQLIPGSAKAIYSGKRFIHSVFHLMNPTVSIVVRTYQDDDAMPQFDYRGNRIRLVKLLLPEFSKKITALQFILQNSSKQFTYLFKDIYIESPPDERYWLLRAFYSNITQLPLLWDFLCALNDKKDQIILETVTYEAMLHKVIQIRNQTSNSEVCLFLALLLNLPSWNHILNYIDRYHSTDSHAFVEHSLQILGISLTNISLNPHKIEPTTVDNALANLIHKRLFTKI